MVGLVYYVLFHIFLGSVYDLRWIVSCINLHTEILYLL